MTLIHSLPAADEPRLHALIIGVSHYLHLPGGGGDLAERTFQLRQARSPKPSALAIANWLRSKYRNDKVKLGSIELLVSPAHVDGTNPVGLPTLAEIKPATKAWYDRCHQRADNIAFFYFCGHGFSYQSIHYLLPQDFGDPKNTSLWENSIDFDTFKNNVQRRCRANTQLFFVDACRDSPDGLASDPPSGQALIIGNNTAPLPSSMVLFHAASPEQKVHVPEQSELTCFAQAFLNCLNGGGAARVGDTNDWHVTTHSLAGTLATLTSKVGERYQSDQSPAPFSWGPDVILHRLDTPLVPGRIDCRTQKARDQSQIRLVRKLRKPMASVRGGPRPWYDDFEQGEWTIEVDFEEIAPVSGKVSVNPPFFNHVIEE